MAIDASDFFSNLDAEPRMTVPALKGTLGNVDYFVITLPFGSLSRYISPTDPNVTDATLRENRRPNPSRYKAISDYILQNPETFRFAALTCTYGKNGTETPIDWQPSKPTGPGSTIGLLTLSQRDPLVIVDGQHRLGAIQVACDADPELREQSIPIILFPYVSIEHAQQLFSDLNRHAKKTTKSLDILFDHRDMINTIVQTMVKDIAFFYTSEKSLVNMEDASVPLASSQVFTLAGIYQATKPVLDALVKVKRLQSLDKQRAVDTTPHIRDLAAFWEEVGGSFPEWGAVARGEQDIRLIRNRYLHWNSGVLSAVGELAAALIRDDPDTWKARLRTALTHPDNHNWERSSPHWRGLATAGNLVLPRSLLKVQMVAYLKSKAGLELSANERHTLDKALASTETKEER